MLYKFLAVICCCIVLIDNVNAHLIEWDAFNTGDGLAVKDDETGLVWLDLSLTAGEQYYEADTLFAGWEHASYEYVEELLDNVFPDITFTGFLGSTYSFEQGCAYSNIEGTCYQTAKVWQDLFGAIVGNVYYQKIAYGMYQDEYGILRMGGSYINGSVSANRYGVDFSADYSSYYDVRYGNNEFLNFSSFLLLTSSLPEDTLVASLNVDEPNNKYMLMFLVGGILVVSRQRVA